MVRREVQAVVRREVQAVVRRGTQKFERARRPVARQRHTRQRHTRQRHTRQRAVPPAVPRAGQGVQPGHQTVPQAGSLATRPAPPKPWQRHTRQRAVPPAVPRAGQGVQPGHQTVPQAGRLAAGREPPGGVWQRDAGAGADRAVAEGARTGLTTVTTAPPDVTPALTRLQRLTRLQSLDTSSCTCEPGWFAELAVLSRLARARS